MEMQPKTILLGSNYGNKPARNALELLQALSPYTHVKVVICSSKKGVSYWSQEAHEGYEVINRRSPRALAMLHKADAILYTHSLSDCFPFAHRIPGMRFFMRGKTVFLQHGVIGLKRHLANGRSLSQYLTSLNYTFDYMVVSSEREATAVAELGIPEHKIKPTGLARFDGYVSLAKVKPKFNRALIFLTWHSPRKHSEKIAEITQLLDSKAPTLPYDVVSHPMMAKHNQREIQISDYSLLITDDSSLAWDFFYTNRDVVFFKPSEWLFKNEVLNSLIAQDGESFIELVKMHQNSQLTRLPPSDVADSIDVNNCARILSLIDIRNGIQ